METTTASSDRTKKLFSEIKKGHNAQLFPGYAAKAVNKLGPGVNDVNGNMSFVFANELENVVNAVIAAEGYEKYENQVGEGKSNPLEAICKDENAGADIKVTVMSGVSTSGKGILQGIK